jgi:glycosyltransferase involved in cell wall biosynthesis
MKISGFSIVRNGVKFDYPFIESIKSILPICDEFVVAVGDSEDGTLDRILALNDTKIKIIETTWDEKQRIGGNILAQQTNIALANITGDWGIYLQADEVVHEKYLPIIIEAMHQNLDDRRVEGLLLKYIHFYGSYDYYANSRSWYRQEIRLIRNNIGVRSWKDAQGFRIDNRKMNVKFVDAYVNHYGWVKHPKVMQDKVVAFNKLWHEDKWVQQNIPQQNEFDFSIIDDIQKFEGTHPQLMADRITKYNWSFTPPVILNKKLKTRLLELIENKFGVRVAEYRNFKLLP